MPNRVLSYKKPSAAVVQAGDWLLTVGVNEMSLPDHLPHWDYQTNLSLRRVVKVDLERALAESTLAPGTELALAAVWTSTGSKLRGTLSRVIVPADGEVELRADLVGADLGGVLLLDTALVLARRRRGADRPVAPRRGGSVLWNDSSHIRLQGDAPQFPIAIVDFDRTNYPGDAAWHLEIGTDLDVATMGSLLLLVNEKKTLIAEALQRAGNPRLQDKMALSMLYSDVARTMVDHALRISEFDDEANYLEETLGATLQELFGRLFPGRSITDVRLAAQESPNLFASQLQAAVKIFEGVV
ncbi:hypothetical protein NN3_23660 [Nocardia neocaledoniensis NBRC 108232]|uniref:Uncharacterized protein n=1 Tax=Nocardia neocaledoniensis TaxID=236511 RepID=A0A317P1W1_9NOCA|nr:hypothetical protein [Nocardia neocaledoniensis]PWV81437.1 hypothetical protein DFR69_101780 [Nocardia neocaledoniensis]GEM31359.1 hypothetical protein NN3_23660 [Nocardia neocaledoniensis NBRC 108232]